MNLHQLDAAYRPFPAFAAWASRDATDFSRWTRETALLAERAGASSDLLDRARLVATRAAAIDTGAIESLYEADRGFTYSVAFETTGWELQVAARGEQVRPLFEAQLHAYEYVLSLATGTEPISEAAIRELHMQICAAQPTYRVETPIGPREQELPKGIYKSLPNHVRTNKGVDHPYAPVDVTPSEMHRLMLEMRSERFLAAHPVTQAAYVHYCLVAIHPFADGNGRVARALASTFTYKAISIPIVILSDQKSAYLDALEEADKGDIGAFTRFMLGRSLDSAELVLESLQSGSRESSETLVSEISNLFERPSLLRLHVDKIGRELRAVVSAALLSAATKMEAGGRIKFAVELDAFTDRRSLPGYRSAEADDFLLTTRASTLEPAAASVALLLNISLPEEAERESEIHVHYLDGEKAFTARIEQLDPTISSIVQLRAELFAERHWARVLSALKPLAEEALRKRT